MSAKYLRHVFNAFYEYLSNNKLITCSQSGFRPKHSCETALNRLKHINDGKLTGVLFINLSKAFDIVNHNVLMHKLKSFGICENSLLWSKSYLCNREQCVVWSDILSKPTEISLLVFLKVP